MAFRHFVTCSMKSGSRQTDDDIWLIGGYAWRHSKEDAINYIEKGIYEYYVRKGNRLIAVLVATINGKKCLQAEETNILLELPSCD